jgi:predicted N-formylglutamate amidohydrolase
MHEETESPLLQPTEAPAARVLNPRGHAPAVLVCEHASRFIPAALGGLGLDDNAARSHAAWDIGALELSVELMGALDAPLVHSRVSRLAYDCNRPPSRDDAMPKTSEVFAVPGNMGLTEDQRSQRIREVYYPFRHLLASTLDARPIPPVLITIHSFTPVYQGQSRSVELGILHDDDTRLADVMLGLADNHTQFVTRRNEPYGPQDGVTHTLRKHGISNNLLNVMIEIRNDLIATGEQCRVMAKMLHGLIVESLAQVDDQPEKRRQA